MKNFRRMSIIHGSIRHHTLVEKLMIYNAFRGRSCIRKMIQIEFHTRNVGTTGFI